MSREFEVRLKPGVTVTDQKGKPRSGKLRGQVSTFDVDESCFWFILRGEPGMLGQRHNHRIAFDDCLGVFTNSEDNLAAFDHGNLITDWKRWHAKESGRG